MSSWLGNSQGRIQAGAQRRSDAPPAARQRKRHALASCRRQTRWNSTPKNVESVSERAQRAVGNRGTLCSTAAGLKQGTSGTASHRGCSRDTKRSRQHRPTRRWPRCAAARPFYFIKADVNQHASSEQHPGGHCVRRPPSRSSACPRYPRRWQGRWAINFCNYIVDCAIPRKTSRDVPANASATPDGPVYKKAMRS